jgi:hypothetical protein
VAHHLDAIGSIRSDVPCRVPNVSKRPVEIAALLQGAFGIGLDAAKRLDKDLSQLAIIGHAVIGHNATSAIEANRIPVNILRPFCPAAPTLRRTPGGFSCRARPAEIPPLRVVASPSHF